MRIDKDKDEIDVKVQIATCNKCNGAVKVAVKNSDGTLSRSTSREFAKLIESGCDIYTTNVIVARTVKFCDDKCEGMWPKKKKEKNAK